MSPLSAQDVSSAPADLQIRFDCQNVEQFIDRYANDLSRGGIFVRTLKPLAVGRMVRLDLQLRDGSPFIAGEGTVFWTREPDRARAESEPGMGVRFNRLTAQSQKMLSYLLAEKAERERAESAIDVDEDFENERTVVALQGDLLAAAWPEKQAAARAADAVAAAELAPIAAPEPMPDLPSSPASFELAPPLAPAEVVAAFEPPPRRRRKVGVAVAVSGLVFVTVMAVLIPKLAAKPSPVVLRAGAARGVVALASSNTVKVAGPARLAALVAAPPAPPPAPSAASVTSLADGLDPPLREQDSCIAGLGSLDR